MTVSQIRTGWLVVMTNVHKDTFSMLNFNARFWLPVDIKQWKYCNVEYAGLCSATGGKVYRCGGGRGADALDIWTVWARTLRLTFLLQMYYRRTQIWVTLPPCICATNVFVLFSRSVQNYQQLYIIKVLFIHQLMHQWVALKTILKFTLKFTLKQLRHVSVLQLQYQGAH